MHHSRISLPARRKSKAEKWPSCAAELWWRLGVSLMFIKGIWEWSGMYGNKCIYMCISIMCTYTYIHIHIYIYISDGKWTILGNRLGHTGTYISSFSRFPSKLKNDEPANAGIVQTMSHNSGHGGFNPSPNYVWHHQSVSQSVTSPVLLAIYPQISSAFLILSPICLDIRDLSPRQQAKNTHTHMYIHIYIYTYIHSRFPKLWIIPISSH